MIDYLVRRSTRLRRSPADVELIMFAQDQHEALPAQDTSTPAFAIDGQAQQGLFGMIRAPHQTEPARTIIACSDDAAIIRCARIERFLPARAAAPKGVRTRRHPHADEGGRRGPPVRHLTVPGASHGRGRGSARVRHRPRIQPKAGLHHLLGLALRDGHTAGRRTSPARSRS